MPELADHQIANCARENISKLDDMQTELTSLYEISTIHKEVVTDIEALIVRLRTENYKEMYDAQIRDLQNHRANL